jgi:hypothetical protein
MAGLEDGPHFDAEGLPALIALIDANPSRLAPELTDPVKAAAMRTSRTVRPNALFDKIVSGLFIVKVLGG